MDTKKWYASKTMWAGIITVLVGAVTQIDIQFGTEIMTNPFTGVIISVLGALGIYGRASAFTEIE